MDLDYMVNIILTEKDLPKAYAVLKELEEVSKNSNALYPYTDKFIEMIKSEKYIYRVRGFRLLCQQARWDINNKIDENLEAVLTILDDEKPTAVRQALAALKSLVPYKADLQDVIKERVMRINYLKYKDTMHSLIPKDIQDLLKVMEMAKEG